VRRQDGSIHLHLLREVVQRYIDRLVLIRFAEDHLVIPPGTLYSMYELRRNNPYTFAMDEHIDGFLHKFDRAHNSALFTRGIVDEAAFSDDELLKLVEKLYEARL
jgi:hypothetical protein